MLPHVQPIIRNLWYLAKKEKKKKKKKLYVETRYLQTKLTNPHIYLWTKGIYSMSFEFEREREREVFSISKDI